MQIIGFNISVDLNPDGSFGNNVMVTGENGKTTSYSLSEWNELFLNEDVDKSQR